MKLEAEPSTSSIPTGLVYLSRIPPSMSPTQLKVILSQYAKVKRVFLVRENEKSTQRRKKFKGCKTVCYEEGWVEFEQKQDAKRISKLLNGQLIGGKKISKFHDDLWNIKYLPGFQWRDLTQQIAYEKKQKELRLRNEIIQAKKESKMYLEKVATSKMIQAIQRKSEKRKAADSEAQEVSNPSTFTSTSSMEELQRRFKQHKVVTKDPAAASHHPVVDGAKLFSKLFGGQRDETV